MQEQWVRTKEAALLLGVSQRSVQRYAKVGKLQTKRLHGTWGTRLVLLPATESPQSSPKVTKAPKSRDSRKSKKTQANAKPNQQNSSPKALPNKQICQKRKNDHKQTQKAQDSATPSKILQNNDVSNELAPVVQWESELSPLSKELQNKVVSHSDKLVVHPTGQPTGQVATDGDTDNKLIIYNELGDNAQYLAKNTVAKLLSIHVSTVKNRIKSGEFKTIIEQTSHGSKKTLVLVSSLPAVARDKYKESLIARKKTQVVAYEDTFASATTQDKHIALATEDAIRLFIRYRENAKKGGIKLADVEKAFIHDYQNGLILAERAVILGKLSIKTLYKKTKKWQASGEQLAVLCPRRKGNVGRRPVTSNAFYSMLRVYALMGNAKASDVYRFVCTFIKEKKLDAEILSLSTAQRFIARIRREQALIRAKQEGAKALILENSYVARQNDAFPGAVWQTDGYVSKILCYSPYNRAELVRPLTIYYMDVATGFVTGAAFSFSERADVMASAWHDALSRWPAPARLMCDNASSFRNPVTDPHYFATRKTKTMTKGKARALLLLESGYKGYFAECGTETTYVIPGHPWSKMIETANDYIFDPFETQPRWFTYCGKDPLKRAERLNMTNAVLIKKHGDKIPTWDYLIAEIKKHIEIYNNTPKKHLDGYTPQQVYTDYMDVSPEKVRLTGERLDFLTMWRQDVKPTRGRIKIQGQLYEHPVFVYNRNFIAIYNVNNLSQIKIASSDGEVFPTPAVPVTYGSYTDYEQSVEAIRANARYNKERSALLQATMEAGFDIRSLKTKDIAKLLADQNLSAGMRTQIQDLRHEQEKYPKMIADDGIKRKHSRAQAPINKEVITCIAPADMEIIIDNIPIYEDENDETIDIDNIPVIADKDTNEETIPQMYERILGNKIG